MAAKKPIARKKGFNTANKAALKAVAKKLPAGKTASKKAEAASGHIYVTTKSGAKAKTRHIAKKATADQIKKALGISSARVSTAESILRSLEDKGRIPRAG